MTIRTIVGWTCSILGAVGFAGSGLTKLIAPAMMTPVFTTFGLPAWTIPAIGLCEIVGVVLVFTALRRYGAAILGVVAVGAFGEHATHGQLAMGAAPLLLGALVVIGVALRSRQTATPHTATAA
jgi:hypothetical protein